MSTFHQESRVRLLDDPATLLASSSASFSTSTSQRRSVLDPDHLQTSLSTSISSSSSSSTSEPKRSRSSISPNLLLPEVDASLRSSSGSSLPSLPPSSFPPQRTTGEKDRLESLDGFRGLTIAVMILVDMSGGAYPIIGHIAWDGIHFADFVMPSFLFIVGVSMALSFRRFLLTGQGGKEIVIRALTRGVKLFLLGVMVQGGRDLFVYDLRRLRIMGILQRIGIAFFLVSVMEVCIPMRKPNSPSSSSSSSSPYAPIGYVTAASASAASLRASLRSNLQIFAKYAYHWLASLLILLTYSLLFFLVRNPSCSSTSSHSSSFAFSPDCNAAVYIDRLILGEEHMFGSPTFRYSDMCSSCAPRVCPINPFTQDLCPNPSIPAFCCRPFEPEGILSTVSAILSVVFGVHFGRCLLHISNSSYRLFHWFSFSSVLVLLGMLLSFAGIPLNKNLYSLSYLFFTGGVAGLVLSAFYYFIDVLQWRRPFLPLIWMGKNAILIFLFSSSGGILANFIRRFYWSHPSNNLMDWFQSEVVGGIFSDPNVATLAFCLVEIAFWMGVAGVLHWKKWYLKV